MSVLKSQITKNQNKFFQSGGWENISPQKSDWLFSYAVIKSSKS